MSSTNFYFDNLLTDKIKFGKYQYITTFFCGCLYLCEACELTAISLTLPIIKNDLKVSTSYITTLASFLFLGIFIGSTFSGFILDNFGRVKLLNISSLLLFIVGIISAFIQNQTIFLLLRFLIGLLIGLQMLVGYVLMTEISTKDIRGKANVRMVGFWSLGGLLCVLIAYFTLDDLSTGNWRVLIGLSAVPNLPLFLGSLLYMFESPRFLIIVDKIDEAVHNLNKIGEVNNGVEFKPIEEIEKEKLILWGETQKQVKRANIAELFRPGIKNATIMVWMISLSANFIYYGVTYVSPLFLNLVESSSNSNNSSGLLQFTIIILGEVPGIIFVYFVIDNQYFGRKKSIMYSSIANILVFILCCKYYLNWIVFLFFFSKTFVAMTFLFMNQYTADLYTTSNRGLGMGWYNAIGKIASFLMPMIVTPTFVISPVLTLILFVGFALIGAIFSYFLNEDFTGKEIDQNIIKLLNF